MPHGTAMTYVTVVTYVNKWLQKRKHGQSGGRCFTFRELTVRAGEGGEIVL